MSALKPEAAAIARGGLPAAFAAAGIGNGGPISSIHGVQQRSGLEKTPSGPQGDPKRRRAECKAASGGLQRGSLVL